MRKRSFVAILMVAFGLSISSALFSDNGMNTSSSTQTQQVTGHDHLSGNSTGDVEGDFEPD